jgi:hypothetical protein
MSFTSNGSAASTQLNTRRSVTLEIEQELEHVVRTGRQLRGLPFKHSQPTTRESDSMKRAITAVFEYGSANRCEVVFKKCIADLSGVRGGGDDDDDGQSSTDGSGGGGGGIEKFWYHVSIELRINEYSFNGRLCSSGVLGDELKKEITLALNSIHSSTSAVTLERVSASFKADTQTFLIDVMLNPPQPPPTPVAPKKRKKGESEAAAPALLMPLPTAEECVQFYTERADTWSLFGADVRSWFSFKPAAAAKKARVYN